jgi:hypothetical protein
MMTDTMHHHHQTQAYKADKQQTDTINTPSKSNKWTCMVCLRKHTTDMKICTICGTSRPSVAISGTSSYASSTLSGGDTSTSQPHIFQLSLNTSAIQSKLYSTLTATSSAKKPEQLSPNSCASQTSSTTRNTNKYLKTWTCAFCNFANDNLKVVCMNCRSSKSDVKLDLKDNQQQQQLPLISTHTIQTKRKLNMVQPGLDAMSSTTTSSSGSCNGRADDTDAQQSKKYKNQGVQQSTPLCTKCNTLSIDRTAEKTVYLDSVTPTKPASLVSSVHSAKTIEQQTTTSILTETKQAAKAVDQQPQQPSLSTLFATASRKWTCKTCLVNNEDDKTTCVCCMTPRETTSVKPGAVEATVAPPPPSSSSSVSITSGSQASLGSLFASTGKKWTCKTCLVPNDDNKTSCVCCTSPRGPTDGTTVSGGASSSSFPSATGGFGLVHKPTTSDASSPLFQFGAKPNESKPNEPIKFGSTGFSLPTFDQKTSSQPVATATPSFSFGSGPQTTMTTTTAENKPLFPKISDTSTQDATIAQPSTSLFANQNRIKIGGDSTTTSESKLSFGPTSGLTFGATTTSTTASLQAPAIGTGPLFTFGSKKDEAKKPDDQAKSGFFVFNNPATTTSATTAAPPSAVFTFGSSGLASSSINFTDNTATKQPSITNSQSGSSLFGSKSITETTTSGNMMQPSGSLFNATAPTATRTPTGGLFQFGATTSTSTLAAPSSGVFGSSTILPSPATPNASTSLFGSSSLSKPFVFSGTEAPTTGFAAFNTSPPKPSEQFKSSLFPAVTTNAFSFQPNSAAATTTTTTAASTSVFGTPTPLVQTGFSGGFFGNTQTVDTPKPFVFGSTTVATPVTTGQTNPITPFAFNNTNTGNTTEQMFGAKRPMATEAAPKDTAFKFNVETPNFNFANPIGTPQATNALSTPAAGGSPAFVL